MPSDRSLMLFLCATAAVTLASIGLTSPVSPYVVGHYVQGASLISWHNSALFTTYNFCAFLAIPGMGALSDRYGRRPMLAFSLLGSAIGYLLFYVGGSLPILYLSRAIDGLTGGNVGVVLATVADRTPPELRTRYFGLVGASSGLGFVIGPGLGALVSPWGELAPVMAAACMCGAMFLACLAVMPRGAAGTPLHLAQFNPLVAFLGFSEAPRLRPLLLASLTMTLPFAALQANVTVLAKEDLHWTARQVLVLFLAVGLVGVFTQAWLVRKVLRPWTERQFVWVGAVLQTTGFFLIGQSARLLDSSLLYAGGGIFTLGQSLQAPAISTLIAGCGGYEMQGRLQGAGAATGAIGRVLGPIAIAYAYQALGPSAAYQYSWWMFLGAALLTERARSPHPAP